MTPSTRRRARARAWWPLGLVLVLGAVLVLGHWGVLGMAEWVEVLVRIVFVMAVAAWIIGDFLRLLVWWFWTRQQR